MKAIILTYAPVPESEQELLKSTNIFKLAINGHAEEYKPTMRICGDYILSELLQKFPQNVISVRERLRQMSKRVEYPELTFKGATILSAVDYLLQKGYDKILIVGDNSVGTKEFQENIKEQLKPFSNPLALNPKIYQYTKGNFILPVKTIIDFCKEL